MKSALMVVAAILIAAGSARVSDALAADPDKADERVAKAVAKLIKKFPPPEQE